MKDLSKLCERLDYVFNQPDLLTEAFQHSSYVNESSAPGLRDNDSLNRLNEKLNHRLNDTGKMYLTHTVIEGKYVLRMVTSQTNVTREHIQRAWELITSEADRLKQAVNQPSSD